MNTTRFRLLVLTQLTALGATAALAAGGGIWQAGQEARAARRAVPVDPARVRAARAYGRLPLAFEANRGQVDREVLFLARGAGATLYLTARGASLSLRARGPRGEGAPRAGAAARLALGFAGAREPVAVRGRGELPGRAHYLRGNDPERWVRDVPRYARVEFEGLYPGVDLVYYGSPAQDGRERLEYDFVVAPGADPGAIRLAFTGAERVELREGDLLLHTAAGIVRQQRPVVYQMTPEGRREIGSRYLLGGAAAAGDAGTCQDSDPVLVTFAIEPHDPALPLVIDPVLTYSTYLGGTASEGEPAAAIDAAGSAYVAGVTGSDDYPVTPGAPQGARAGSCDLVVSKLNPAGTALEYSTYVGGIAEEFAPDIAVDAAGSAYVAVQTFSVNYPTTDGAFDRSHDGGPGFCRSGAILAGRGGAGADVAVTKLHPNGSALVYSTFLGGSEDEGSPSIAVGADGTAYVALQTVSFDYPTTDGAYDRSLNNLMDISAPARDGLPAGVSAACADPEPEPAAPDARLVSNNRAACDVAVTRLNAAGSALLYSTYLGGTGADFDPSIALHGGGSAYVACSTDSLDYPVTMGAFDPDFNGTLDFGVTQLNADGSDLVYSTFLGGPTAEIRPDIAVDAGGCAVVTGLSIVSDPSFCSSCPVPDYPITPNAYDPTRNAPEDVVATRLNAAGNALLFSTFLGESTGKWRPSVALDAAARVFVAFSTGAALPVTPDAVSDRLAGPLDYYVLRLDDGGTTLGYGTYLGGSGLDRCPAIAVAPLGTIFVAGVTSSADFPVAPAALDPDLGGTEDLSVSRISELFPTITPPANPVAGEEQCFAVLVEDEFGQPAPGVVTTFTAAGSGGPHVSESMLTGPDGRALFCFTPAFPGMVHTNACVDANNNAACDPGEASDSRIVGVNPPPSTGGLASGSGAVGVSNGRPRRGRPRNGAGSLNFTFHVVARRAGAPPTGRLSISIPDIGLSGRAVQIQSLVLGPPGQPRTGVIFGILRTNQVGLMVPFRVDLLDAGRGSSPDQFNITLLADTNGDMVPEIHVFGGVLQSGQIALP